MRYKICGIQRMRYLFQLSLLAFLLTAKAHAQSSDQPTYAAQLAHDKVYMHGGNSLVSTPAYPGGLSQTKAMKLLHSMTPRFKLDPKQYTRKMTASGYLTLTVWSTKNKSLPVSEILEVHNQPPVPKDSKSPTPPLHFIYYEVHAQKAPLVFSYSTEITQGMLGFQWDKYDVMVKRKTQLLQVSQAAGSAIADCKTLVKHYLEEAR